MKSSSSSFGYYRPGRKAVAFAAVATMALGSLVSTALATDYYWRSTDNSSTWNTTSKWFTSPTGGTQSGGMSSADTYIITNTGANITNTDYYQPPTTGATSTFLGGTLVLATGGQLNIRAAATNKAVITNFVTTGGGTIAAAYYTTSDNLMVDSFDNQSGSTALGASSRDLNLEIGTLSGSGGFSIVSGSAKAIHLSITDATAYTGDFNFALGTINFDNDLISGGSLTLSGTAVVTLDQSVTFASVTVAGTALTAGFHSFADLNTDFDAFFTDGGSGGITVGAIPEPSSLALLAGGAALLGGIVRRRRRA